MGFRENGTIVFSVNGKLFFWKWDNWVCIKSRALGVKVDQRLQSQPAGLEQGVRERTKVLVIHITQYLTTAALSVTVNKLLSRGFHCISLR